MQTAYYVSMCSGLLYIEMFKVDLFCSLYPSTKYMHIIGDKKFLL